MSDPRVEKLADLLVNYSFELKSGQKLAITSNTLSEELMLAVYKRAIQAGAHAFLFPTLPEANEIFYKYAGDDQLEFLSPVTRLITETFDARLYIDAEQNTRSLTGVDPAHQAHRARANRPLNKIFNERVARGELKWCYTVYPTHAAAQEADMSLADYQDFVYTSGKLNEPDPVAAWREDGRRMAALAAWLAGRDQVVLKGANIDLKLSIKGRTFIPCDGKYNFPDGEIFTGPIEDSASGWVRFSYPVIYQGREVESVELWFENGRVVRENASKNLDFLTSMLNTDEGSRYLGELGIGTNYNITRFTKNMLFDEKLGGTIHLAVGEGFPESGSKAESGIHWDMLCDMHDGEVMVDGELFYQAGKPVAW